MENKKVVTLLNIASVTNFIFASFFFLNFFDSYSISGIISIASLVLAGMYYQNLTKESLDEIKEQKRKLLLVALLTIIFNPLQTLLICIVVDEADKKSPNKLRGSPKKEKVVIDPQIKKLDLLLKLGVTLVLTAGIIFTTQTYENIPDVVKVILILSLGLLFHGLSKFSEDTLKLEKTTNMYYLLGMSFIVLSYVSFGYYNVLNLTFEFYFFTTALLVSGLLFISEKKYNKEILAKLAYISLSVSLYYLVLFINFQQGLLFLLIMLLMMIFMRDNKALIYSFVVCTTYYLSGMEDLYIALNGLTLLVSLYVLAKNETNKSYSIISAILMPYIVVLTFNAYNLDDGIFSFLAIGVLALTYCGQALLNYNKNNKSYLYTYQLTTNLLMLLLALEVYSIDKNIALLSSSFILITHFIYLYINTDDNKIEFYTQLIKVFLLIFALFNVFEGISEFVLFTALYLVSALLEIINKNEYIKKVYLCSFILSLSYVLCSCINPFLGCLAILYTVLLYAYKPNNYTYMFMLGGIAVALIFNGILDVEPVVSSLICLFIYMTIMIVNRKDTLKKKMGDIIFVLPLWSLVSRFKFHYDIKQLLYMGLAFYVIYLIDNYFIKNKKDKFEIFAISAVLLLNVFTESVLIGIVVGTISILLIVIGINKERFKHFVNVGIIFTLLNLIYQLRTVLTEIPLPIYLLIAGLTILGVVTYKMKKELGKK